MEAKRLTQNLYDLSTAYARHRQIRLASLSTYAGCQAQFFVKIARDKPVDFKISTYDRLVQWFSQNWPDDLQWPVGLERPRPLKHERNTP
jgi:hypothetical protein